MQRDEGGRAAGRRAPGDAAGELWRRVGERFWALPLLCAAAALGLGVGLSQFDDAVDTGLQLPFLFSGGPEGARALLSAIITSMISFTALVFSLTIVVLQLTSSQFSPRVLRNFLGDRFNQLALGVFVATFVYALVVLRAVRGTAQADAFVPQLSVTVAFLFVLASVAIFLAYIDHIAQSIRAATIVASIGADTRELLERRYPSDGDDAPWRRPPSEHGSVLAAGRPGVVQRIDDEALLHAAEEEDLTICVLRAVGEFVPAGAPIIEVHGEAPGDLERFGGAVELGTERSLDEDVGFGFRQLVDIAERALSPGTNDPSTAVQAIDQLHDLLRHLATRPLPPRQRFTQAGRLAVDVPGPAFADYLGLATDEIARWGADSSRVQRRLDAMLVDLEQAALPQHRVVISRVLAARDSRERSDDLERTAASDTYLRR